MKFEFDVGGGYRFNTNFSDDGDVSQYRLLAIFESDIKISRDWSVTPKVEYTYDRYYFSPVKKLDNTKPWNRVHNLTIGVNFRWSVTQDWTLFMGPLFELAAEDGADLGTSLLGGGFGGVMYRVNDRLMVGGGLAVSSQIEDDVLFLPLLVLQWKITEKLSLGTRPASGATGFYFILELAYDLGPGWEIGIGGAYERRRFRLSNSDLAPFPGGVGQTTGIPLFLRVSKYLGRAWELEFFGGFSFYNRYEVYNSDGNSRGTADLDPQPFVHGAFTWRF
jgi:hypothetical protein